MHLLRLSRFLMMGEDTPLLYKSSRVSHDKKELAREFDALKDGKLRRYNFCALLGLSTVVTGIILLLLTPFGCIVKSLFGNTFESVTIFTEQNIFGLSYKRYLDANPLESTLNITDETLRIVLLGDSLINKPYQMHDLSGKMQYYLSQYPYILNFTNCGFNGNTIAAIKGSPLTDCALSINPHAVILFWDSDCSNVSEYLMTESEVSATRSEYAANVALVVDALVQSGNLISFHPPQSPLCGDLISVMTSDGSVMTPSLKATLICSVERLGLHLMCPYPIS